MASWVDVFSLIATLVLVGGFVFGVIYVVKQASAAMESTKESLKNKGWNISDKGVSVKTSKNLNREEYLDATQRTFVKAFGASTYGNSSKAPTLEHRQFSGSMSNSDEKKKGTFDAMRRSYSSRSNNS